MTEREIVSKAVELICKSGQGVPCLIGNTGVGKTDLVKQLAQTHKKKLIIINTAIVNVDDLSGFPYREGNVMKWAIPDWFPREKDCILFLDEFNRADKQVINALMPLLLSSELHYSAKLPEDCWVIVAFNPDTDDYDMVNSFDDLAISSRLFKLEVTNDPESWANWAMANLNSDNKLFKTTLIDNMRDYSKGQKKEIQINQLPNNRSFAKAIGVVDYAKKHKDDGYTFEVIVKVLKGILGLTYVNENLAILQQCMLGEDNKIPTIIEMIDTVIKESHTRNQVVTIIKDILDTARNVKEEYVELRDNMSKFDSFTIQSILANLNYDNEIVSEVFDSPIVDIMWNNGGIYK